MWRSLSHEHVSTLGADAPGGRAVEMANVKDGRYTWKQRWANEEPIAVFLRAASSWATTIKGRSVDRLRMPAGSFCDNGGKAVVILRSIMLRGVWRLRRRNRRSHRRFRTCRASAGKSSSSRKSSRGPQALESLGWKSRTTSARSF